MNDVPQQEFSWQAHPARERAGRAALGVLIVIAMAVLIGQMMQNPWWGLLAIGLLVAFLNRFFFPSRFSIDAEGITARYPLRRLRLRWADLRRFVHDENGGFLSTRATRSWLDAYRGMHILFGRQRESVIDTIRAHLPERDGSWA